MYCRPALLCALLGFCTRVGAQSGRLVPSVLSPRELELDGQGPVLVRAVLYSPTFWGPDDSLYYQVPAQQSAWAEIFQRDLRLIRAMGANAVRVHGFAAIAHNSQRHDAFLNEASAQQISVLVSYDLVGLGDNAKRLADDRADVLRDFRGFIRAARGPLGLPSPVVMVMLGDSINRGDAGFVCHDSGDAALGCQFGDDVEAFADGASAPLALHATRPSRPQPPRAQACAPATTGNQCAAPRLDSQMGMCSLVCSMWLWRAPVASTRYCATIAALAG